jgi:hypothetical protein
VPDEIKVIQSYLIDNYKKFYNINDDGNIEYYGYLEDDLKVIPKEYMFNDKETRLSLLAGIIDLKGDNNKKYYRFSTKSKLLAEQIMFLCGSLGLSCTANKVIDRDNEYYRVKLCGKYANNIPVKLEKNKVNFCGKDMIDSTITVEKLCVDDYYGLCTDGKNLLLGDFTVV